MPPEDISMRTLVLSALFDVAPDLEKKKIRDDLPLQDEYGLDSADFLNFLLRLNALTGIDVPADAYPSFSTVSGATAYLIAHKSPG